MTIALSQMEKPHSIRKEYKVILTTGKTPMRSAVIIQYEKTTWISEDKNLAPNYFSVILRSKKQFQLLHIEVITKYHLGNPKKNNVRSWMNSIGLQHVRVTLNKEILPSWMLGRQVMYRDVMLQNPETISFAKKVKLPNHQFDAIVIRILQNTVQYSNESIFINFISAREFNSISSHGFYVQVKVKEVLWLH